MRLEADSISQASSWHAALYVDCGVLCGGPSLGVWGAAGMQCVGCASQLLSLAPGLCYPAAVAMALPTAFNAFCVMLLQWALQQLHACCNALLRWQQCAGVNQFVGRMQCSLTYIALLGLRHLLARPLGVAGFVGMQCYLTAIRPLAAAGARGGMAGEGAFSQPSVCWQR